MIIQITNTGQIYRTQLTHITSSVFNNKTSYSLAETLCRGEGGVEYSMLDLINLCGLDLAT